MIYPPVCGICGKINENFLCIKCRKNINECEKINKESVQNMEFEDLFYLFKYSGEIRKKIIEYKFLEKSYLYKTFIAFFKTKELKYFREYDFIIPVPISRKRLKERGYNQSLLIAKEMSKMYKIRLSKRNLIKNKNNVAQSTLGKEERSRNVINAYEVKNSKDIYDKKILLIDDILTTGNTVNECAKILKKYGAKKVDVFVIAKD